MKTYRQALTEALPEPYASLAISRMSPDDVDDKVEGRIIGSAFTWAYTPEGHEFWEAVQFYTEGRGQLPPLPGSTDLESRILILESRIAFLESLTPPAAPVADEAATRGLPDAGEGYIILGPDDVIKDGDEIWLSILRPPQWDTYLGLAIGQTVGDDHARRPVPATVYPTTPLPEGYDKWVCRGQGWKSKGDVWYVARNATYGDPFGLAPSRGTTSGFNTLEYWEAVRTRPRYRLLVSGEVIRDGDEAYIFPPGEWVPSPHSGSTFCELELAPIRRPITDYTDAP